MFSLIFVFFKHPLQVCLRRDTRSGTFSMIQEVVFTFYRAGRKNQDGNNYFKMGKCHSEPFQHAKLKAALCMTQIKSIVSTCTFPGSIRLFPEQSRLLPASLTICQTWQGGKQVNVRRAPRKDMATPEAVPGTF